MTPARSDAKQQSKLDSAADKLFDVIRAASRAEDLADTDGAKKAAREAMNLANGACNDLIKAGATSPMRQRGMVPTRQSDPLALSFLSAMDTPEARELLDLLERAQTLADVVDRQRGRALSPDAELLPGESYGTDIAESISEVALRLRRQIHGAGAGRE